MSYKKSSVSRRRLLALPARLFKLAIATVLDTSSSVSIGCARLRRYVVRVLLLSGTSLDKSANSSRYFEYSIIA